MGRINDEGVDIIAFERTDGSDDTWHTAPVTHFMALSTHLPGLKDSMDPEGWQDAAFDATRFMPLLRWALGGGEVLPGDSIRPEELGEVVATLGSATYYGGPKEILGDLSVDEFVAFRQYLWICADRGYLVKVQG